MKYKDNVDLLKCVNIGGIDQYILERGDNKNSPVILFLHGGPGTAQIGYMPKYQRDLEKRFIVVNWDQRGAGLSYSENIPKETMNIERYINDTVEVTNYLRKKYNKEKIYLVGHSWGTILGMKTIHKYPELFISYIGVGQVANMIKGETIVYNFVNEMALKSNNIEALNDLKQIDPPPYKQPLKNIQIVRKWVNEFEGVMRKGDFVSAIYEGFNNSDYYSEEDIKKWEQGSGFNVINLLDEMLTVNLYKEVNKVNVPVTLFGGRYDYTTPSDAALEYYKELKAPHKEFVWFEESAHIPMIEENKKFNKEIIRIFNKH